MTLVDRRAGHLGERAEQADFVRLKHADRLEVVADLIDTNGILKTVEWQARAAMLQDVAIDGAVAHAEIDRLRIHDLGAVDLVSIETGRCCRCRNNRGHGECQDQGQALNGFQTNLHNWYTRRWYRALPSGHI